MKIGLVGKTNTGKSTFFKAASLVDVEISNRIFTTIDANKGVTYITSKCPCVDLEVSCDPVNSKCRDGTRLIPVELIDVAGLVPGAHEGKGLGNKFLSDLMEAEGLIHILDLSGRTDEGGNPTSGYDPEKDIDFLYSEIDHWIRNLLKENWDRWQREVSRGDSKLYECVHDKLTGLGVNEDEVKKSLSEDYGDLLELANIIREESKPIVLAGNKVDLPEARENYDELKDKYDVIPICAEGELALREAEKKGLINYIPGDDSFEIKEDISEKRKKGLKFIKNKILDEYGSTGVQEVLNKVVFDDLNYIVVYPVESSSKYCNG
ncbi:MAG: YchF-related putative GTPase, partial [archaeon]